MKQLLQHTIRYLAPFWVLLLLVFALPVDKRMRYQHINNDCYNHGIWVHDRIFKSDSAIDIAFLGSSRTINGVRDSVIQAQLQLAGKPLQVANLAYCRYGCNLYYVLAKELLRARKVKTLIIEVREDESQGSHPIFPYLADERDVLLPRLLWNGSAFSDLSTAFFYKLQLHQDQLFSKSKPVPPLLLPYGGAGFNDTVAVEKLAEHKTKRAQLQDKMGATERNMLMAFPRHYLHAIHALCVAHGVQLRFLYLPSWGTHVQPFESSTYQQYGDIIRAPQELFDNNANWFDEDHLNNTGAQQLSAWLAAELEKKE